MTIRFILVIYFGIFTNGIAICQNEGSTILNLKDYVKKIDSLCSIMTYLNSNNKKEELFISSISEGSIESKKRNLKGGFSNKIVSNPQMDSVYLIHFTDNLDKCLFQSYYFKSNKLVFSKIELQDCENENKTLFLQQEYYKDDKVVLTTLDRTKLKKKYNWRVKFNAMTKGYFYLKEFSSNKLTK